MRIALLTLSLGIAVVFAGTTLAQPTYFSAIDATAPNGPRPNSTVAETAFTAAASALGQIQLNTFESVPLGNFTSLNIGGGVTVTQAGHDTGFPSGGITNATDTAASSPLGYNTTSGGARYLRVCPTGTASTGTTTFAFATPIRAFGAMITDLEPSIAGAVTIHFNDGSAQSFPLRETTGNSTQFFGFTDPGRSISSIAFVESGISGTRDIYGIDDVRFVNVPEPVLATTALAAPALLARRRRRN